MWYKICHLSLVQLYADVEDCVLPTSPTLHNLTHLRLTEGINNNGFNLNVLNDFLEYSPNLEVLVHEVCWKSITGLHWHWFAFGNL